MDLRPPEPEDGLLAYQLVKQSPPLDLNSVYCYLLQCSHFANTSVVATSDEGMMGFISGYRIPDSNNTLFIWQVAVNESARGQGLAMQMLEEILRRDACNDVAFIETTITRSNRASWALFQRLADTLGASINSSPMFEQDKHFAGAHETEMLVRIGPLPAAR